MRLVAVAAAVVVAAACASASQGPAGALFVSPSTCDFGHVGDYSIESCTVTIGNHGDAPLEVDTSMAGDEAFDLVGRIADGVIDVDRDLELQVRFAPAERRGYEGVLHVGADDDSVDVALLGNAS